MLILQLIVRLIIVHLGASSLTPTHFWGSTAPLDRGVGWGRMGWLRGEQKGPPSLVPNSCLELGQHRYARPRRQWGRQRGRALQEGDGGNGLWRTEPHSRLCASSSQLPLAWSSTPLVPHLAAPPQPPKPYSFIHPHHPNKNNLLVPPPSSF